MSRPRPNAHALGHKASGQNRWNCWALIFVEHTVAHFFGSRKRNHTRRDFWANR
jgi:hypothetical protein